MFSIVYSWQYHGETQFIAYIAQQASKQTEFQNWV